MALELWQIVLAGIGGIFALQMLIAAVLMIEAKLRRHRVPPEGFPSLTPPPATVASTQVQIYTEGRGLFDAMLSAIEGARETIYLETFIWKGDVLGERFKRALTAKAREGVQIYLIYDTFANMVVPRAFFQFPPAIHVLPYRAWRRPWHAIDFRRYGRDHRKILVVDGRVGFVGGYNIGELYRTRWRDTHLRLDGPEVDDLVYAFVDFWNANRYPHHPKIPLPARAWASELRAYRNDPVRLIFPIRSIYIEAIEQAQRHIFMTQAYFIPDEAILQAIMRAARRGVDVRVLVPWQSNHVLADWLARHSFDLCLRSGVRVFAYQGAMIHAKSATIDAVWSMVGTANIDRLSLVGNYEINMEIFSPDVARSMEEIFICDLTNAHEIRPEEWARRSWVARASEMVLAPLWPLL
ncbi:phosphatidylserine/phosphatidylglycerophosphate/cardiolipin synthase family protein [Oscillochloris sp. ZM17-4]|uniref:phospholipase D-like domain-containing protein n=1 Tax=Oscillochloris sp. ZM17-4 TaxID=2866714 RepID=UPI001C72DD77|nr:phospholipase D-like domain-containing protein [Oscillochloris sp. ZM17-4]MBX0327201.1 phosphatidylserine/phosphatidylglycerophosphate/cardiolipin synthase family protein [Oscillochloris sp. ZM17-4]